MADFNFRIDQHRLDEEWLNHPRAYHAAATALADAQDVLRAAAADRDVTRAEVSQAVRADPVRYDLAKVTEAAVADAVLLSPELQDAEKAVREAQHHVDVLRAAVTALDHKKKALENLVDLHGRDYFSEPQAKTPEARQHADAVQKDEIRRRAARRRSRQEEDSVDEE